MPPEFSTLSAPGRHPERVLYLVNDLGVGGAQRALLGQAAGLDRARFLPEVASLELVPRGGLEPEFRASGCPVHLLRGEGEPLPSACVRLGELLRERRPALLHTHLAAAGVAGRLAARGRGGLRLLATLHNLSDWQERSGGPLRWLDRRTLDRCAAVVTVSDAVGRAVLARLPRLGGHLVTVYNGVDLERIRSGAASREAVRERLALPPDAFVVGAVARLDPRKGLDTLLAALAVVAPRSPGVFVLLVGDGPERSRLVSCARRLGIASRVRFAGGGMEARDVLPAFDLFAAPSRTEGLGIAILEALAASVPALASRVGGIPEVVEDGVCGLLLPPDEPGAWAAEIERLAIDREALKLLAARAPERARRFSIEASVAALERVYEAVLAGESVAGLGTPSSPAPADRAEAA